MCKRKNNGVKKKETKEYEKKAMKCSDFSSGIGTIQE